MMNFQSMKNEQELNTMHDSFLTALRKYKVLARGEQFISENGAITDATAENLRKAQEAVDGTMHAYNEQLTMRAYFALITDEKPFTAWLKSPIFPWRVSRKNTAKGRKRKPSICSLC